MVRATRPRSTVHPAVQAFGRVAEVYERSRPDYPAEAIARLVEELELAPGADVIELGAGTGKLTRALLPSESRIRAVEPMLGMRRVFRRELPGVRVLRGTAERIPRPAASADAVVAGQAFHWFRPEPTLSELHRVLRPGGRVGLVWNRRDESIRWVAGFGRILEQFRGDTPRTSGGAWRSAFRPGVGFAPLVREEFRFVHRLTREQVAERALSVSFIGLLPEERRLGVRRAVEELLDSSAETRGRGAVDFPYVCEVFLSHRV